MLPKHQHLQQMSQHMTKHERKMAKRRQKVADQAISFNLSHGTASNMKETDLQKEADEDLDSLDMYSSQWQDTIASGGIWGGRKGFGGRGWMRMVGDSKNVNVYNVTLAFSGRQLLEESHLQILHGRKYGLIGQNGVGKSTLLRRIARGALPGFPPYLSTFYVHQEIELSDLSALESLLRIITVKKENIEKRISEVEGMLDEDPEGISAVLSEMYEEVDVMERTSYDKICARILRGLGFSKTRMRTPLRELSGGWRMKTAIGEALFSGEQMGVDILLLDEPTNHLDMPSTLWLMNYLAESDLTFLVVSHDRAFLDAVCTDIIQFEDKRLKKHPGDFSSLMHKLQDRSAFEANQMEANLRQQKHIQSHIDRQQKLAAEGKGDDKKLSQLSSSKKKLDRIGKHRQDGKRWHLFTKAGSMRGEVVESLKRNVLVHFELPTPTLVKHPFNPLVSLENVCFAYDMPSADTLDTPLRPILCNVNLTLRQGVCVGLVGPNGSGKTTLLRLLLGELQANYGAVTLQTGVTMSYFSQVFVDRLNLNDTPLKLLCETAPGIAELEARKHLGSFGLGGNLALQPLQLLSGGQRSRVYFALITVHHPAVLVLDEPTNHLDYDSQDALSIALHEFTGCVIIASHNQSFLQQTCTELYSLEPYVQEQKLQFNRRGKLVKAERTTREESVLQSIEPFTRGNSLMQWLADSDEPAEIKAEQMAEALNDYCTYVLGDDEA